jgi:hypothetical protein
LQGDRTCTPFNVGLRAAAISQIAVWGQLRDGCGVNRSFVRVAENNRPIVKKESVAAMSWKTLFFFSFELTLPGG